MGNPIFEQALEKGSRCERLSRAEAYSLARTLTPDRLHRLGEAALANRQRRFGRRATYVFNLQINPSNICGSGCTFCNYAASKNAPHAYVMEEAEIFEKVERLGPTEVHIVGGLNQIWDYTRNLELVRSLRSRFAGLHIKAYTAVEIDYFARTAGLSDIDGAGSAQGCRHGRHARRRRGDFFRPALPAALEKQDQSRGLGAHPPAGPRQEHSHQRHHAVRVR
jgi:aminodeoxyfutalosine synthase